MCSLLLKCLKGKWVHTTVFLSFMANGILMLIIYMIFSKEIGLFKQCNELKKQKYCLGSGKLKNLLPKVWFTLNLESLLYHIKGLQLIFCPLCKVNSCCQQNYNLCVKTIVLLQSHTLSDMTAQAFVPPFDQYSPSLHASLLSWRLGAYFSFPG